MTQLPENPSGPAPASWFRGRAWLLFVPAGLHHLGGVLVYRDPGAATSVAGLGGLYVAAGALARLPTATVEQMRDVAIFVPG